HLITEAKVKGIVVEWETITLRIYLEESFSHLLGRPLRNMPVSIKIASPRFQQVDAVCVVAKLQQSLDRCANTTSEVKNLCVPSKLAAMRRSELHVPTDDVFGHGRGRRQRPHQLGRHCFTVLNRHLHTS